jgi:hypothetical protein
MKRLYSILVTCTRLLRTCIAIPLIVLGVTVLAVTTVVSFAATLLVAVAGLAVIAVGGIACSLLVLPGTIVLPDSGSIVAKAYVESKRGRK